MSNDLDKKRRACREHKENLLKALQSDPDKIDSKLIQLLKNQNIKEKNLNNKAENDYLFKSLTQEFVPGDYKAHGIYNLDKSSSIFKLKEAQQLGNKGYLASESPYQGGKGTYVSAKFNPYARPIYGGKRIFFSRHILVLHKD